MSIPFCIAGTLLRGAPTMKFMTTYDDAGVNDLVGRTELIPDEGVPKLCSVIDVTLADGAAVQHDQRMAVANYNYDRKGVSELIRRIGAESDVPMKAYENFETFVEKLPNADFELVLQAFAMAPKSVAMSR
jgi:hypothetical protein